MNINVCMLIINSIYFDYAIVENSYFLVHFNVFSFVNNFFYFCISYLMFTFKIFDFISNLTCFDVYFLFIFGITPLLSLELLRAFEIFHSVELYIYI